MTTPDLLLHYFPFYSEELGIDLSAPSGRFKWFLASILFGARISEQIAMSTFRCFERYGLDNPEKILAAGWDELVRILDEGGYVRYDFSTATKLLGVLETLRERYGSLEQLNRAAKDTGDLEQRLREFTGIGPVTAQIFLRELRGTWQIHPEVATRARSVAAKLGIDLGEYEGEALARLETALVKLSLRYCKRGKCAECPVHAACSERTQYP
jgi:endonuclease III